MKLILKNIGIINQAVINLDGLTVIAGDNDTGKSFAGRTLFTVMKSMLKTDINLIKNQEKLDFIQKTAEELYILLRKEISFQENLSIQTVFDPKSFFRDIKSGIEDNNIIGIEGLLEEKKTRLKMLKNSSELFPYEKLLNYIILIDSAIFGNEDKETIRIKNFEEILASEFNSEICMGQEGAIELYDGNNPIMTLSIDKESKVKHLNIIDGLYFKDVTIVESPVFAQFYEVISNCKLIYENKDPSKPVIPLHIRDLIDKMSPSTFSLQNNIVWEQKFSQTIDGNINFSQERKDFIYSKEKNGEKLSFGSLNTATGIKSFGVISLLKKAGVLDKRCVLIIDEPEVHLHPKWQIEYAKIITELVKEGVIVLVTTHSPYMVQAFSVFSKEADIKSDFYLSHKNDNGTAEIENVSEDINKIFLQLSKPLNDIVWGQKYAL